MIADLKPYPEYKESGLSWLDQVPSHWEMQRSKYLFREVDQRSVAGAETRLSMSQRHGLIPSSQIEERRLVSESNVGAKLCEPGDLVLNRLKAHLGVLALSPTHGLVSPDYTVLRPIGTANHRYFCAVYRSPYCGQELRQRAKGIVEGFWRLYTDDFYDIRVPLPPPAEQSAIVRFLDWANGQLERAIRAKRKVIALLNEQKQAIISSLVTGKCEVRRVTGEDGHEISHFTPRPSPLMKPSGIPWLGDIPQCWEVKRAKQVCAAIIDCKNRTPDMVAGGAFTVVRTTNIRHGKFNLAGSYSTDQRNYDIWTQRGAPRDGDVFFTREAPVGEACLVPGLGNLCMGQRMMYFRPQAFVLDAEFLLNSIYGPVVRRYIEIESNGSTVGHLRLGQVSALPLLWCPIEEQKKIVAHIATESAPLNTTITRLEREIELLREYRTRLVADVVTGKLDVREAAARLPDVPADTAVELATETLDGDGNFDETKAEEM